MRVKCYSVKLEWLIEISDKAFKAKAYDGSSAIIPISQVYGEDIYVNSYWITEYILSRRELQYSKKREAWFDSETMRMLPSYKIKKHKPKRINPIESNEIDELKSDKR